MVSQVRKSNVVNTPEVPVCSLEITSLCLPDITTVLTCDNNFFIFLPPIHTSLDSGQFCLFLGIVSMYCMCSIGSSFSAYCYICEIHPYYSVQPQFIDFHFSIVFLFMDISTFIYPFYCSWTCGLFPFGRAINISPVGVIIFVHVSWDTCTGVSRDMYLGVDLRGEEFLPVQLYRCYFFCEGIVPSEEGSGFS